MLTNGQFIRRKLVSAGNRGTTVSDVHKQRVKEAAELSLLFRGGTYASFTRLFSIIKRLKWIEATGEVEPATQKGGKEGILADRVYYRITEEGLKQGDDKWQDPLAVLYPEWNGSARSSKYRVSTGRPRGRPRIADGKVVKKKKEVKIDEQELKRLEKIALTNEEKRRLLEDFESIMGRKPSRAETNTLYAEELKLKRRRGG